MFRIAHLGPAGDRVIVVFSVVNWLVVMVDIVLIIKERV